MKYKWTTRLTLLTPALLLLATFIAGGGHGWYQPAAAIFPFGMLGMLADEHYASGYIFLAIIQFPLYGFIFDWCKRNGYQRKALILGTFIHVAVATIIIYQISFAAR